MTLKRQYIQHICRSTLQKRCSPSVEARTLSKGTGSVFRVLVSRIPIGLYVVARGSITGLIGVGGKVVKPIGLLKIVLDFEKLVSGRPVSSRRIVRVEELLPILGRIVSEDFVLIGRAILSVAGRHVLFVTFRTTSARRECVVSR